MNLVLLLALQQVPSNDEQALIYEINRARENPVRYAVENGLGSLLNSVAPKPPLAVNAFLVDSASFHAEEMANNDYFGHQSQVDGRWPNQMAIDEGYALPYPGNTNNIESLAAGYSTILTALRGLIEDAGVNPPGHREHLLATGSGESFWNTHREIGTGYATNAASTYVRYYAIHTARVNLSDLFLTGVVYNDANGNGRYDSGEGIGGVTISDGTNSTLSNAAGGWSLATVNGSYTVTATGGAYVGTGTANVTVSGSNIEIDFESGTAAGEVNFANQPDPPPPGGGGGGGGGGSSSSDDDDDDGGCGLLGIEVLLALGLVRRVRRN
jgi:MYXO-CTERM domain-containing protein